MAAWEDPELTSSHGSFQFMPLYKGISPAEWMADCTASAQQTIEGQQRKG